MIVITGASGGLGSAVITELLRLTAPGQIVASVRAPDRVEHFARRGVHVRQADFDDPLSLDRAFKGARRVLVISTNMPDNATRFAQHSRAIDAAWRSGAERVYYTSIVQRWGTPFLAARGHHDTEAYLESSGISYTVFRNGHYMENLPTFLAAAPRTGYLDLPADGPTAWVARDDLAEGIARALIAPPPGSESLLLTGPCAYDFTAIAALLTTRTGIQITRRVIEPEDFVNRAIARGISAPLARMLASGFTSRAAGELAQVTQTLQALVQRPLRRLEDELPRLFQPLFTST